MSTKEENIATQKAQRDRYMSHEIDHQTYYIWLADFIGAGYGLIPVSAERVEQSTDPHLNDITLATWDHCDPIVRQIAFRKGLAWSLSDTVCVLKALARKRNNEQNAVTA
jgi:hypothetical protein